MGNGSCQVLLVEGDRDNAGRVQDMLRESDGARFELTHVTRLREALHCLEQSSSDVILLDLGLPDERGLDTFVRTHAKAPETPIVVLAGTEGSELALKAIRLYGTGQWKQAAREFTEAKGALLEIYQTPILLLSRISSPILLGKLRFG